MNEAQLHLNNLDEHFIKHRISSLQKADLSTARIDRLKGKVIDLLRAYVSTTISIKANESIFRARKHRIEERELFLDHVNDIYPDEKYIRRLGRANREKQCVYYFGADNGVALSEVRPNIEDVVTVLECKPLKHAVGTLIPIGIHEMAKKHNVRLGGDFPEPAIRIAELLGNDPEAIRKHQLIDDFVLREFLRDVADGHEHLYKLSIAIAEILYTFENDLADIRRDLGATHGLAYPSLASEKITANVAFLPEAFHRIYRPIACKRLRILEVREKNVGGENVNNFVVEGQKAEAIAEDGSIAWLYNGKERE